MASPKQTTALLLILAGVTLVFFAGSVLRQRRTTPVVSRPTVRATDPVRGAANPQVTVVEFGDYQCPFCKDAAEATATIDDRSTVVRRVWKDFPLAEHPQSFEAAVAARCAQQQGRFWPFHDALFARQSELGPALYTTLARELQLDENAFARCQVDPRVAESVEQSRAEGVALGITALPTIFVNSQRLEGSITANALQRAIASERTSR